MKVRRRILTIFCYFCLLLSLVRPAAASETEDIQRQLLQYYLHHQDNAESDILHLLEQLKAIDPEQAEDWTAILSAWSSACNDLVIHPDVLPDGLPEDDSLCIVVLGYRLDPYGRMLPELIGRLELALNAANQYPNAHIICTGGGTASEQPNATEAGQMARWLKQQGVDPE